ncbi:hypothetical protein CLK_0282 [Clostridium botulinum A3 str. Loch Maree]|nr:hypothetical protein CLK_0282 [Clostridium botulinum A3 str. Loch Maree]
MHVESINFILSFLYHAFSIANYFYNDNSVVNSQIKQSCGRGNSSTTFTANNKIKCDTYSSQLFTFFL